MTQTQNTVIGAVPVGRGPRRATVLAWTSLGVVLTLALGGYVGFKARQTQAAQEAAWSVTGPRCPAADIQTLRGGRPPMTVSFDGATLQRRSGFVECAHRPYDLGQGRRDYAVCQFSSPQAVGVTIGGVQTLFAQPINRSLRIVIADDKPICVVIDRLPR